MTPTTRRGSPLTLEAILGHTSAVAITTARAQAAETDRDGRWPEATLKALQAAGLGGLVVPAEHGGLGYGLHALLRCCEILGRECASSAIAFGMHAVGSAVIAAKATPEQRARYLDPINAGSHLTTLALSEPGTGAHFYYPQTLLSATPDGAYRVNGTKAFVTNGAHADSYVLSVRSAEEELGEFSCLVLPGDAPGMTWGAPWQGLGMRGNSARTLELRDVPVEARDLLGAVGDQIWYVFHVIAPYFLMAMSGTYLGVADAALRETMQHLAGRRYTHGGRNPAQESVVQHRVASLWEDLERTRQLVYAASCAGDAASADALPLILTSKAAVADTAVRVVNEAMSLAGGVAYRDGSVLERHLRDVRAAPVMAPTTDLLRIWAGRALLGQPLLGE